MQEKQIKIVYCIAGTYNSGGMERVLANKANWLSTHGYEITIITTDQRGQQAFYPLNPEIRHIDLGINYESTKGVLKKALTMPRKLRLHKKRLNAYLMEIRPDIVISLFDNGASIIPQINDGSKKILEVHFSRHKRIQYGRRGLMKVVDRLLSEQDLKTAKSYDHFVVLTHQDREYWEIDDHISVIPNALQPSFRPGNIDHTIREKKIIAVGRLAYQKNFEELIHIFSLVNAEAPEWTLEIVGNGPDKDQLQRLIERLGLQDSVILTPATPQIQEKYLSASIYAMTSRYEGLPMVLIEAQACGLPIVSYDCKCGPRDIITEGKDGYIIPMLQRELFAEKILTLIKDEESRDKMSIEAHKSSLKYEEDRIMTEWTNLFESVLNG